MTITNPANTILNMIKVLTIMQQECWGCRGATFIGVPEIVHIFNILTTGFPRYDLPYTLNI
jgi:hypothetical protein